MTEIFNTLLVHPIINILVLIYLTLVFLHIPYALGFSIIILTIIIRLVLYPLTASQLKASRKMQDLAPHISKIKDKHKGDTKKQQEATMRLYKEHGVNPAAGCLPTLLQLPVIWGLYSVLMQIVNLNSKSIVLEINKITYVDFLKLQGPWDQSFFGIPLGQNPSHLISTVGPIVFLVPFLTGLFQFIQSKMMFAKAPSLQNEKGKPKGSDFASAFQSQSLYIFPIMIGFFSYTFPMGLSLYWNTFTIFGILQQYKIQGLGGLEDWIKKIHPKDYQPKAEKK